MSKITAGLMTLSAVILGAMAGYLIGMPLDVSQKMPLPVTPLSTLAGALIGWRRRESRPFIYFSAICVLMLATLVFFSMIPKEG